MSGNSQRVPPRSDRGAAWWRTVVVAAILECLLLLSATGWYALAVFQFQAESLASAIALLVLLVAFSVWLCSATVGWIRRSSKAAGPLLAIQIMPLALGIGALGLTGWQRGAGVGLLVLAAAVIVGAIGVARLARHPDERAA